MNLKEISETLGLESLTPEVTVDAAHSVAYGYASDLLSDVLAHAQHGGVLVTVQIHMNVVAVAAHAGLVGVVFPMGRRPEEPVRQKAAEEGIALYTTEQTAFEVVGRLYELGVRGTHA